LSPLRGAAFFLLILDSGGFGKKKSIALKSEKKTWAKKLLDTQTRTEAMKTRDTGL